MNTNYYWVIMGMMSVCLFIIAFAAILGGDCVNP